MFLFFIFKAHEVEDGEKEEVENVNKETVDEFDENEQEFSRQLQACTAQMESTMLDETMQVKNTIVNSTAVEDPSLVLKVRFLSCQN